MSIAIDALLTGKARAFGDSGEPSAIGKTPVAGSRHVGFLGIAGDEQGDLTVHGGPDKAIHHYPRDHYPWWIERLGGHPLLAAPGAFGENLSTRDMVEDAVCIGDRYRLGTALVEVSQGRKPCWKPAHRLGRPALVAEIVRSSRSGWYYRVIEPGVVAVGDMLKLEARPCPDWTVARVFDLIVGSAGRSDPAALRALGGLKSLSAEWRDRARRMAA